jgi:DNA repair exonuclease SbcCD ATPase subunit
MTADSMGQTMTELGVRSLVDSFKALAEQDRRLLGYYDHQFRRWGENRRQLVGHIRELDATRTRLQTEIASQEAQLSSMRQQHVHQLQQLATQHASELQTAQQNLVNIKFQYDEKLSSLTRQRDLAALDLKMTQDELSRRNQQNQQLQQQMLVEIQKGQKLSEDMAKRLSEGQLATEAGEKRLQKRISDFVALETACTSTQVEQQKQMLAAQQEVQNIRTKYLEQELLALRVSAQLQNNTLACTNDKAALLATLRTTRDTVQTLQTKLTNEQAALQQARDNYTTLEGRLNAESDRSNKVKQLATQYASDVAKCSERLKTLTVVSQECANTRQQLETKINVLDSTLKSERVTATSQLDAASSQLDSLRSQLLKQQTNMDTCSKTAERLKRENTDLQNTLVATEKSLTYQVENERKKIEEFLTRERSTMNEQRQLINARNAVANQVKVLADEREQIRLSVMPLQPNATSQQLLEEIRIWKEASNEQKQILEKAKESCEYHHAKEMKASKESCDRDKQALKSEIKSQEGKLASSLETLSQYKENDEAFNKQIEILRRCNENQRKLQNIIRQVISERDRNKDRAFDLAKQLADAEITRKTLEAQNKRILENQTSSSSASTPSSPSSSLASSPRSSSSSSSPPNSPTATLSPLIVSASVSPTPPFDTSNPPKLGGVSAVFSSCLRPLYQRRLTVRFNR